jgi:hypothetical protein
MYVRPYAVVIETGQKPINKMKDDGTHVGDLALLRHSTISDCLPEYINANLFCINAENRQRPPRNEHWQVFCVEAWTNRTMKRVRFVGFSEYVKIEKGQRLTRLQS